MEQGEKQKPFVETVFDNAMDSKKRMEGELPGIVEQRENAESEEEKQRLDNTIEGTKRHIALKDKIASVALDVADKYDTEEEQQAALEKELGWSGMPGEKVIANIKAEEEKKKETPADVTSPSEKAQSDEREPLTATRFSRTGQKVVFSANSKEELDDQLESFAEDERERYER